MSNYIWSKAPAVKISSKNFKLQSDDSVKEVVRKANEFREILIQIKA